MQLEDQVCSLELAKKLRELGVTQDSTWYWVKDGDKDVVISYENLILAGGAPTNRNVFSAFTVAELGEMLAELAATQAKNPPEEFGMTCWEYLSLYGQARSCSSEADSRALVLSQFIQQESLKATWLNR